MTASTTTRLTLALLAVLAAAAPALARTDCPQERAIYTERENGYRLSFRTPDPWEAAANVGAVLELRFPDGETVWGTTWMPNGTSWNQADLFHGCKLPGPIDETNIDSSPGTTDRAVAAKSGARMASGKPASAQDPGEMPASAPSQRPPAPGGPWSCRPA